MHYDGPVSGGYAGFFAVKKGKSELYFVGLCDDDLRPEAIQDRSGADYDYKYLNEKQLHPLRIW